MFCAFTKLFPYKQPYNTSKKQGFFYRFLGCFSYGFFAIFWPAQIPYIFNRKNRWYKPVFLVFVMLKWGGVFRYPPHSPRSKRLILGRAYFLLSAVVKAGAIIGQMIAPALSVYASATAQDKSFVMPYPPKCYVLLIKPKMPFRALDYSVFCHKYKFKRCHSMRFSEIP